MTLVERIQSLCKDHDITFAALERRLDFGNGTIRKWDKATPSGDKLSKVADYFLVSVDYLLGRDNLFSDENVDENYAILSRNAKKLSTEDREKLLKVARTMFDDFDKEDKGK